MGNCASSEVAQQPNERQQELLQAQQQQQQLGGGSSDVHTDVHCYAPSCAEVQQDQDHDRGSGGGVAGEALSAIYSSNANDKNDAAPSHQPQLERHFSSETLPGSVDDDDARGNNHNNNNNSHHSISNDHNHQFSAADDAAARLRRQLAGQLVGEDDEDAETLRCLVAAARGIHGGNEERSECSLTMMGHLGGSQSTPNGSSLTLHAYSAATPASSLSVEYVESVRGEAVASNSVFASQELLELQPLSHAAMSEPAEQDRTGRICRTERTVHTIAPPSTAPYPHHPWMAAPMAPMAPTSHNTSTAATTTTTTTSATTTMSHSSSTTNICAAAAATAGALTAVARPPQQISAPSQQQQQQQQRNTLSRPSQRDDDEEEVLSSRDSDDTLWLHAHADAVESDVGSERQISPAASHKETVDGSKSSLPRVM